MRTTEAHSLVQSGKKNKGGMRGGSILEVNYTPYSTNGAGSKDTNRYPTSSNPYYTPVASLENE